MTPTHAVKKGKRYRYYVSTPLVTVSRSEHPEGRRIPAGDIEGLVLDCARSLHPPQKSVTPCTARSRRPDPTSGVRPVSSPSDAQREACEAYIVSQRHMG
jgi:hypothetical protein